MRATCFVWALLAVVVDNAIAQQHEPPDEAFLAFLGGLEADDDWEAFFESVPDESRPQAARQKDAQAKTEDEDGLD